MIHLLLTGKKGVCSNRCYNSELPFFTVDSIDMMSFLFGDKQYPCGKCDKECIYTTVYLYISIC